MKFKKLPLSFLSIVVFIIFISLAVVSGFIVYDMNQGKVISVNPQTVTPTVSPLTQSTKLTVPSITPFPKSPQSIPPALTIKKSTYVIAAYGDSMVDTMGEHLEHLQAILKQKYPNTIIKYYNYGVGSENVSMGLARFDKPLLYKERNYPPISGVNADILILGSFSYNPYSPHDPEKHKLELIQLVNHAKKVTGKVYLLAEIAPLNNGFGKGEKGINWGEDRARKQAEDIIEQLDDTVSLAKGLNIPLINVYHLSQTDGQFGSKLYVNQDDGIHPSDYGHKFMADLIAKTIKLD